MSKLLSLILLLCLGVLSIGTAHSQRNDYALIFAADNYEHLDDISTISNAKELGEQLKNDFGFEVDLVENYTNLDVMQKIREYFGKKYGKDDQLMIYFAGHGFFDIVFKQGFVACANSNPDSDNFESYIQFNTLRSLVNRIPCNHIMLTLNTGYARYFDPEMIGEHWVKDPVQFELTEGGSSDPKIAAKLEKITRLFIANGSDRLTAEDHEAFHQIMVSILSSGGGDDEIIDVNEMTAIMKQTMPVPRAGGFGADVPGSDFLLIRQ